jgi:diguanylate cyclase (GGDEF)-like protein
LFGSQGFMGLLTAHGRLGDARAFDLGDTQLLETIGAELATALERGHLLADLQRTATTDPLTGLPNLAETARLIDLALANGGGRLVLAAVTVESFREVNDTLGHEVGDALLFEAADRLRRTHPEAMIGRIGGGRFAVAMPTREDELSGQLFGLGLRSLVEGEARLGQVGTHVRLAVGVAQAPEDGTDADTLLRRAETAMSSARHAHGGPVAWAPAYEVQGQRRLAVVTALREAVATGAIGLNYQPKVDVRTGAVTGVEALARWTHPALGQVSPDEFIPLAETSGAIGPLTSAVLRQAATACRGWQRRAPGVGISVNVSAETVLDPYFVSEVAAVLTSTGLPAELLTLELTESVLVGDPELAGERLGEIRALGSRIAVDDFGTGYSSLIYLKGLPVDEVKIDKGFVSGLGTDPADAAVVRAVVDIAHTLGLTVVAEGVETVQQLAELRNLGVEESQGYLHAKPMPAQSMATWLRQRTVSAGA